MSAAPSESAGADSGAVKTSGAVAGSEDAVARFQEEGCSAPRFWGNGPGDRYGRHAHDFHTADGDVELEPGDRLDLEPGVEHAAAVGPRGVSCVEATR